MCDTFVALGKATKSGEIIFAKNSDRQFNEAQYLELLPGENYSSPRKLTLTYIDIDQLDNTNAVLLSRPHWIWGAEMGVNEHGLVIGNEAIFSRLPAATADGIIGMDLLRLALERACDVDEAVDVMTSLLAQYGQGGNCGYQQPVIYENSFIISDEQGAKVLETAGREWVVRPVVDTYAISNTMTIEKEFSASSPALKSAARQNQLWDGTGVLDFKSAFEDQSRLVTGEQRRRRASQLLENMTGKISVTDAFRVLRDHGEPTDEGGAGPGLCMHAKTDALGQTTASLVSSLGGGKQVHWVTGTAAPCISIFKPVTFETGIPDHGAKPGADEEDVTSLWWRHMKLMERLLENGKGGLDVDSFVDERDELEAGFVTTIDECPPPEDEQSRDMLRTAVNDCWGKAMEFENRWIEKCL